MKLTSLSASLAALPILLATVHAQAEEEITVQTAPCVKPTVADAETTKSSWYGWQILSADAGSVLLSYGLGVGLASPAAAITGGITYLGAGPVIHGVHGNLGAAFGSLGLRTALPVLGTFAGVLAGGDSRRSDFNFGAIYGGIAGFTVGIATASVIDAVALAHESVAPKPVPVGKVLWRPNLGLNQRGAEVGVSGAF